MNPVGEKGVVGELLETYDLTTQFQHGWALDYRIRRDDGEEVHAEVRCWDRARETAEHHGNTAALDAIADRGVAAALALAESAESPASIATKSFCKARNPSRCRQSSPRFAPLADFQKQKPSQ